MGDYTPKLDGFKNYDENEIFNFGLNGDKDHGIEDLRPGVPIRVDLLQHEDIEKLTQTNPSIVNAILQCELDFLIFKYEGLYPVEELKEQVGRSAAWFYLFLYFDIPYACRTKLIPAYNQKGILQNVKGFFLENITEETWIRLKEEGITPESFTARTKKPVWVEKKPN